MSVLTALEIQKLISHCRKSGISEFEAEGLKFKFTQPVEKNEPLAAVEDPIRVKDDMGREADRILTQKIDEMAITDPAAYEDMIAKILESNDQVEQLPA